MSQKFLDLAGLTAYDKMLKEWFKAGLVDITNDAINALFPVVQPNNEIWYTTADGTIVSPSDSFNASVVSNEYNDGKGVIKFDNSVTRITVYAFQNCSSLTSITIPNSITHIEMSAFQGCSSLTSITIPNSVTNIAWAAFCNCSAITSITIPNSVTGIGSYSFQNCSSLASIIFEGTMEEWNRVTKASDWNKNVPATCVQCTDGQVPLQ
jgi:hypothetical protein